MSLRCGLRLGPFEIVAPLGAGGMGEVYKATDTRLGRTVAIKVLPPEFSADKPARIRFEREAKAISALSHPHICALHDIGSENGLDYLVLEHCEGQTLAERLVRGRLPFDQVLEYGIQIAEALDKAHRHGIVHRDLKPSNIMITKSGVKLLDFGLASLPNLVTSQSNTDSLGELVNGDMKIVGTVQYMAPETLARGQADARSDIFAFGLVLYEMASGQPAFREESYAKLIAAILEHEPPEGTLEPRLDRIVRHSLRKDPDARWQNLADVAMQLRWAQANPQGSAVVGNRRLITATVTTALVVVAGIVVTLALKRPEVRPPKRLISTILTSEGPLAMRSGSLPIAISPDGASLVYSAGSPQRLFIRSLSNEEASPIAGTEGGSQPFFSPDGKSLGFTAMGKLRRVHLDGGEPRIISDSGGGFNRPAWGETGMIVFTRRGALWQVPASGGPADELLKPPPGQHFATPTFIPGGRKLLFSTGPPRTDANERSVAVLDIPSRQYSVILKGATDPRYTATGHLLFVQMAPARFRTATIFSVAFDPARNLVSGNRVPRVNRVAAWPLSGIAFWTVGSDGSIFYIPHDPASIERELIWIDREGHVQPATTRVAQFADAALSPDGTRVAYSDFNSIWIGDLAQDTWLQVTGEELWAQQCVWSPDGSRVAYESIRDGMHVIAIVPADGSAPPTVLVQRPRQPRPTSWSSDGEFIAFDSYGEGIWTVKLASKVASLLANPLPAVALTPAFSPDGRWLASISVTPNEEQAIHVQRFPGPSTRQVLFTGAPCPPAVSCGNNVPQWSPDGRKLFFRNGRKAIAVEVKPGLESLRAGKAEILFETGFDFNGLSLRRDATMFLAVRYRREPRWDHINVLSGWADRAESRPELSSMFRPRPSD